MKTPPASIIKILAVILLCFATSQAGEADQHTIVEMKSALQKGDLNQFVRASEVKKWKAPMIGSAWHTDNRTPNDKKADEASKRALGKLLEERISAFALQLGATDESDRLYKGSETLLALANWLEGAEGYGNLLLAAHARDVATIGIGKLLIRLDYPFEKSVNLVASLNQPPPATRARVLNREAGAELFPSSSQQALEEVWRSGALLQREQQNPDLKAARLGNPPKELEELAKVMQKAKPSVIETPAMRSNLPFFKDDDAATISGPPTLANTWDRKRHEEIVSGLDSQNVIRLRALAKFRSTVGSFPTDPVKHPFYKGGEAAFDNAWRPHASKEEYNLGRSAWRTYEAIQKGEFWDADTTMLRPKTERKATPPR